MIAPVGVEVSYCLRCEIVFYGNKGVCPYCDYSERTEDSMVGKTEQKTTIAALENGPLLIRVNEQGIKGKSIALCRCGASENKPYCDGAHSGCGFEAPAFKVK